MIIIYAWLVYGFVEYKLIQNFSKKTFTSNSQVSVRVIKLICLMSLDVDEKKRYNKKTDIKSLNQYFLLNAIIINNQKKLRGNCGMKRKVN